MNRLAVTLLYLVAFTAVPVTAAEPVALRVEVSPLGSAPGGARVAVTVYVSPEDRGRIGANAMLRVELDGAPPPGQSPLWAVRMAEDGSGRIETVWPAGEHRLEVEISSPSRRDSGLWVGTVRIPDSFSADEPDAVVDAAPRAGPEPGSQPEPGPEPGPEAEPAPEGSSAVAGEAGAAPAGGAEDDTAASAAAGTAASPAPAEAAVSETPSPAGETAAAERREEAAAPSALVEEAADPPAPAAPVAQTPEPIVEPLRGDPAAPPNEPPPDAPEPALSPPAVAAAHAAWVGASDATSELTAVVLRGREPVRDLRPADLRLVVEGVEVAVEAVGGAGEAPLLLGIAVDAGPESGLGWPGSGDLAPLTERVADGLGSAFYASSAGPTGGWGEGPPTAVPAGAGGDVASLVVDSLRRFDGMRGRRFLLVVTDGRNEPGKEAWREAVTAAGEAGTPVLVVALWDEGFSRRTRNNLREIAEVSGGSLFLAQGRSQLDRAAVRFGPLLDAGVAVRFEIPAGTALPARVALAGDGPELEVSAPRFIR